MTARCDECRKFRKPADLKMVYTGGPMPEPDHYACAEGCRPVEADVIRFPKRPSGLAPNMLHVCVMQSPACSDGVCEACEGCGCECHLKPHVSEESRV